MDSWRRWGLRKAQRRKGFWLGNEEGPSFLPPGIFTLGSIEKSGALKESIFSYGKSDTSLDKFKMAESPLRTPDRQQAHSDHQESEGREARKCSEGGGSCLFRWRPC